MNLNYTTAPANLRWSADLFDYIQQFKAGTFDRSAVYSQFAWLIVPEITAHGAGGPFTAYFAIQAPDANNDFNALSPITGIAVWSVQNHEPETNLLSAQNLSLPIASVLAASSATALEQLIFRGDDHVTYLAATPDRRNDVLHGWNGNDSFEVWASGGNDSIYGGAGNDRISAFDSVANSLHGVAGSLFGYGDAGNDTVMGDEQGDHLFGGSGRDGLQGNDGRDSLFGGAGNDRLNGGKGSDRLYGGDGADQISGSLGADSMAGGGGADLFVFTWGGSQPHYDSGLGPTARDEISGFTRGTDHLKLLESSLAHVDLIGAAGFTAANQVRWVSSGGNTTVFVNGPRCL